MTLPRFSLRTLLLLVALISIPIGWVAYQVNWVRQRQEFIRNLPESREGQILADHASIGSPPPVPWHLRIFGDPGCTWLSYPPEQEGLARRLFPEYFRPRDELSKLWER